MDLTHLAWIDREPGGADWLSSIPLLLVDVSDQWSLVLGDPYLDAHVSYTAPARCADGTDAVLKLQYPHRECLHEAAALVAWAGGGAARLLDHDPERHALLLERCDPGVGLAAAGGEIALDVLMGLVPRLWIPADGPFDRLEDEAAMWVHHLSDPARTAGLDGQLVDHAAGILRELGPSQSDGVLLHQDLHGSNVISATREPWLAIDPKPLIGEREFSVSPIVRDFDLGFSRPLVRHRLDRLCAEWNLDRDRARGWTIGQTIAWSTDSQYVERHEQTVRWLLDE